MWNGVRRRQGNFCVALTATDGSLDRWTNTAYDAFYHLLPVSRSAALSAQVTLSETASYYAGESKPLGDPWAYWGGAGGVVRRERRLRAPGV